jgi:GNAT superfamily N-acetyltransferase
VSAARVRPLADVFYQAIFQRALPFSAGEYLRDGAEFSQKEGSAVTAQIELTLELARELELAEARAAVQCAESINSANTSTQSAVEPIAGGYAVFCGPGSPVTQAVGLGLHGAVTAEEFDRLETFYFERREAVRVETCPMADAALMNHYKERGYHISEFSNVMARPVSKDADRISPPGVEVRVAGRRQIDLWVLTVCQGFAESYPVTQELMSVMKMFALVPTTKCFLATIDGRVVGGATLAVRGRIAGLFGASTLPEFRKRGVQTALLRKRLAHASELGCTLAMSLAQPGSISQRNITKAGFQTLYTRVKLERDYPGENQAGNQSG